MNANDLDIPARYLQQEEAYLMGWADFEAGLARRPLQSPWLTENYRPGHGDWSLACRAWLAGFDRANILAPVPGWDE